MNGAAHREAMRGFFQKLVENYGPDFTDQGVGTCLALYGLCLLTRPEYVVEVGTGYGASTIAFAQAMLRQGKSPGRITTICRRKHARFWRVATPRIQGELIEGLRLQDIHAIEAEFQDVDPASALPTHDVLVFYDIHDTDQFYSRALLEKWIPRIERGFVAIHDFSPVQPGKDVDNSRKAWLRTQATHFSGTKYRGYGEVAPIIWWLNEHRVPVAEFEGGVWFEIPWRRT